MPQQQNPRHGELMEILRGTGTPAEAALGPTHQGSLLEVLLQLAQWMGMALPGRGGLGMVRFPMKAGQLRTNRSDPRAFLRGSKWPARQDLTELSREMDYESRVLPSEMGGAKAVSPRALTLGRYLSSDTLKPGYGEITEPGGSFRQMLIEALMNTLWSHHEIPPRINLP